MPFDTTLSDSEWASWPVDPALADGHIREDDLLGDPSAAYPTIHDATRSHELVADGTVAPMNTLYSPATLHEYTLDMEVEPMPPFYPTPPLQKQKSHRRSLSDRIRRAFCT